MGRSRSVWYALSAGVGSAALLLQGCGGGSGGVRAADPDEPVNTGLAGINESPGLALPDQDELMRPDRDKEMIRAQIEESARQLSVYFTNLELDAPPSSGQTMPPAPTSRTGGSQGLASRDTGTRPDSSPQPGVQATTRSQPNPQVGGGDDGGVRVSLRDLAKHGTGDETDAPDQPDEIVEPGDAPAQPSGVNDPQGGPAHNAQADQDSDLSAGADARTEPRVPEDPRVRRDTLARELAAILSELVVSGQDPGASVLALASLETLVPDDTGALVDEGVLSEPERASIDAVRSLLGAMTSEGAIVSPAEMSERLEQIKQQVDAWAGLRIRRAALCTRVDGYGRYETFPNYRFTAGQAQEVIVYTELERFAQRESTGPDGQPRFGVELSQRLELYHVADDLNTWNRAAETVRDESRNRLRDYYLTNRVFLPTNLGVGRYHLKVVMRDLIGEKIAETIIPIEIVAR